MADQEIKALIEGGKASPAPPLGPALGPTGVNIGQVIAQINQQTQDFRGMKVPVTIIIHQDRTFDLEVGIPTTSGLVLKEAGLQKGGKGSTEEEPEEPFIGNITMQQVVKIADMKRKGSFASTYKTLCKEILGTCLSCKISVEGKNPKEVQSEVDQGVWDSILQGKE
ncbi:MAG: 50S ribosomal protein L11 [Candidatus Heimdallarchaeota archaeon]|nr:50S ribosomal protein L11 [Candidatus Heimdallarchaeota archaeon]